MLSEKAFLVKKFKLVPDEKYEKQERDDLMYSEIVESLLIFGGAVAEPEPVHRVGAQKATLSRLYGAIQEWWGDEVPKELEPETEADSGGPDETEWVPVPDTAEQDDEPDCDRSIDDEPDWKVDNPSSQK